MTTELVRIERIAAGGDGVGRLADGRVLFVPRAAPGDLAEVRLTRTAARFARGTLQALREPGPGRVEPACRHYRQDECGGCQLQHLDADTQRAMRRTIAGDALRRIGRFDVADPPMLGAGPEWEYRTKVTLTRGRDGAVGYHRFDRPGQVFPMKRCPIAAPALNALWERARAVPLPGNLERLVLRRDRLGGDHLILVMADGEIWRGGKALHAAIGSPAGLTIWWRPAGAAARAVAGSDSAYPATAFEQVNPAMGDQVRGHALGWLGPVADKRVWDLYAGIGETSELLAEAGARVTSVEWDRGAVAEAERRQARFGRAVDRVAGAVESAVASLGRPDLVIANPPRGGLDRRVVDELKARAPSRIVYVSCDPATLARDLAALAGGGSGRFTLREVAAFDLFPQTAHVETVALLERT